MAKMSNPKFVAKRTYRKKALLPLPLAALLLLALTGTAYGVGALDWLIQQERSEPPPESAFGRRLSERTVIASQEDWGIFAWWSESKKLCIDVAFRGQSGTGCGFPVVGATRGGVETRDSRFAAGMGSVQGRGPRVLVGGIAAANVARVDLVLVDGRTVRTRMHPAPRALASDVRFFVGHFQYAGPLPPPSPGLVTSYLAYDESGRLLGASP
jgi:hypothetical protein